MSYLSSFYIFNFAHVRCFFLLSTAQYNSSVNWAASARSSTMTQFVPPQVWTRHAVLPGIRAGSPNKNISGRLGGKLRTVQRIRKVFGESMPCTSWFATIEIRFSPNEIRFALNEFRLNSNKFNYSLLILAQLSFRCVIPNY